jgi:hypothetical protein
MSKTMVWRVKNTCAVQVHLNMNGQLTHSMSHPASNVLYRTTPSPDQRKRPEVFRIACWKGTARPVLVTMTKSLKPSCHVFAVIPRHGLARIGLPVSLRFRSPVVITSIASPIQNSTKKPLKSLCELEGSKWDTRSVYSTVGKSRLFARICCLAVDID